MATLAGLRDVLRPRRRLNCATSFSGEAAPVDRKKKKKKKLPDRTLEVLNGSLMLLRESSSACPPLQSAVGGLAHIVGIVQAMKGNEEEAHRLFQRADSLLEDLSNNVTDCTKVSDQLLIAITVLDSDIQKISSEAIRMPKKHPVSRFFNTVKEREQLRVLRVQLDEAIERFKLGGSIRIEYAVNDLKAEMIDRVDALPRKFLDIQALALRDNTTPRYPIHDVLVVAFA